MITINLSTIGNILRITQNLRNAEKVGGCITQDEKPLTIVSDEPKTTNQNRSDKSKAFSITQMIPPNPLLKK